MLAPAKQLTLLAALPLLAALSAAAPPPLQLPLRFHANVTIVAHLVDRVRGWLAREWLRGVCRLVRRRVCESARAPAGSCAPSLHPASLRTLFNPTPPPLQTQPYPPWLRRIEVWYDLPARKVKAVVHEGFDAGKTFLRRYDLKQEYVLREDEFAECRRAYLSACGCVCVGGGWGGGGARVWCVCACVHERAGACARVRVCTRVSCGVHGS